MRSCSSARGMNIMLSWTDIIQRWTSWHSLGHTTTKGTPSHAHACLHLSAHTHKQSRQSTHAHTNIHRLVLGEHYGPGCEDDVHWPENVRESQARVLKIVRDEFHEIRTRPIASGEEDGEFKRRTEEEAHASKYSAIG